MNDFGFEFSFLEGPLANMPPMQVESVSGKTVTFTTPWPEDIQPNAGDAYFYSPVNPNVNVSESDQVDVIDVFNGNAVADQSGTLTATHLTGFGLGPDTTIAGDQIPGGIRYEEVESLNIELGSGNNDLTIESTHVGSTNIYGAEGVETIDVKSVFGHTTIDLGAESDTVNVGNDENRIEQITSLLTVLGGPHSRFDAEGNEIVDVDVLNINDRGDRSGDVGTLKQTSITGFDMPSVPEVQVIRARAATGKLVLRTDGFGSEIEPALPVVPGEVERSDGEARVIFDITADDSTIRQAIANLYGYESADVAIERDGEFLTIMLQGEIAGLDFPELEWDRTYYDPDDVSEPNRLQIPLPQTVDVRSETTREGTFTPAVNNVQTIEVVPIGGTFQLQVVDSDGLDQTTSAVADDVSVADLLAELELIVDPNNENLDLPHTRNVAVSKHGNVYKIEFRGERRTASISQVIMSDPAAEAVLLTRTDGIDYRDIETLNIDLGSGHDVINVHGTTSLTNIQSHDGNDQFMIASTANADLVAQDLVHGDLDLVAGQLNLDSGLGDNALFVSDYDASVGDGNVVITDATIDGLAPAQVTYDSTGGTFDAGLSIWTSQHRDVVHVTSVDVGSQTKTSLNTGDGNDDVRVEIADDLNNPSHSTLSQSIDRRLHIRTMTGADVVDASRSQLAMRIESGTQSDVVKGGDGDDRIHSGDDSDIVFGGAGDDYLAATSDSPGGPAHMDDEIVFGDHGTLTYQSPSGDINVINSIEPDSTLDPYRPSTDDDLVAVTTDNTNGGGADDIYTGDKSNIVLGGLDADLIVTGSNDDMIFGDGGEIIFGATGIESVKSIDTAAGGADEIRTSGGNNLVFGGNFSDNITTNGGSDFIFGDAGEITYAAGSLNELKSIDSDTGATDTIQAGSGFNIIFGGQSGDFVTTGDGLDFVFGDAGKMDYEAGALVEAVSIDTAVGGGDILDVKGGVNVVFGGQATDTIASGNKNDFIFGDGGQILFQSGKFDLITTIDNGVGDEDLIFAGEGQNVIFGGQSGDEVNTGGALDFVFGDGGHLSYNSGKLVEVATDESGVGGDDTLNVGGGVNIVFGGSADDEINSGDSNDFIFGDGGTLIYDGPRIGSLTSTDNEVGGVDTINAGTGSNVVFGGAKGDTVNTGDGADFVFGDGGGLNYTEGKLVNAVSADGAEDGDDTLTVGNGFNIVFGGLANDDIDAGSDRNYLLGDGGEAIFNGGGVITDLKSTTIAGGDDEILSVGINDFVIAGAANDTVTTGSQGAEDVVLGDHGLIRFDSSGRVREAYTTDSTEGGDDTVQSQTGRDIVFGGPGQDELRSDAAGLDTSRDVVFGDSGYASFDTLLNPILLRSTDYGEGDNDTIYTGGGDDVVLGGFGDDLVESHAGDDIAFGDSADLRFTGGVWTRLTSLAQDVGGDDRLVGDIGNDILVGGANNDVILGGANGDDILIGDNVLVVGNDGSPQANDIISTGFTSGGGVDQILDLDGHNQIIGGDGEDSITGGDQRDWIAGDYADVLRDSNFEMEAFQSVDEANGGNDRITGNSGFDVVLAGAGDDVVTGNGGKDVIVGDSGRVLTNDQAIYQVTTTAQEIGGNDELYGNSADDFVFGGAGADIIDGGGSGDDYLIGDNADAHFNSLVLEELVSIDPTVGGNDTIFGQSENDFIVGGSGDDTIDSGVDGGADVVVADHARAVFDIVSGASLLRELESHEIFHAGFDNVVTGDGPDIVFGGSHDDTIHTGSDNARDIMVGDNAKATFDALGVLIELTSTSPGIGSTDFLTSTGGRDIVIGGRGYDTVNTVATAATGDESDIVLGDSGKLTFDNVNNESVLRQAVSTEHLQGHKDTLDVGNGDNVVIAGSGDDVVNSGVGKDVVLGDNGVINFNAAGSMIDITSLDAGIGGADKLKTGAGEDVAFGGAGNDLVETMEGNDIALGDSGTATFDAARNYLRIESLDQEVGGSDHVYTGTDDDIAIGGTADDIILGGTGFDGDDIILGDNGLIVGSDGSAQANDILTTGFTLGGGNDAILADGGRNIIIAGDGDDYLEGGGHRDWLAGDYVDAIRGADSEMQEFVSIVDDQGGNDDLVARGGWDIVVGGAMDDTIFGHAGKDLVFGDNAQILTNGDAIYTARSTSPGIGGNDDIFGNEEDDVIVAGFGEDTVSAGSGNDFVFGDNATVDLFPTLAVDKGAVTDPTLGAADTIQGDAGHDTIIGGTSGDNISGGTEHDVILGDHGRYDLSLPVDQRFESTFITADDDGGVDTIHGDAGDDFILGGQAGDELFGDAGEDDITGGHNVRFGVDADDTIQGGTDADVILGDNGVITRSLVANTFDQWAEYPAPFADVIRTVTRYDDIDRVTGNDTINAGDGDDRVFGQRGNDSIDGGTGDDELIGHLGDDTILGGAGHDTILSDVGTIIRDFLDDDTPFQQRNGSWHRDVILEDVGNIVGVIDMDQTPLRVNDPALAQKLITTDLLVLSAGQDSTGQKFVNGDNGAWDTDVLLIDLLPGNNDTVDGGGGDDYIFGQRGDDNLSGGADDDYIFGDNLTNSIVDRTELPKSALTYRLLETSDPNILLDEAGSVIVTPVTKLPEEMDLNNPYGLPDLFGNVWHEVAGGNAGHAGYLTRADGSRTMPVVGIIPDVVHHIDSLPGNDTIAGDGGNDFIVGDNANAYSPLITGIMSIEGVVDVEDPSSGENVETGRVAEKTHVALARAMHSLGVLSVDYLRASGATAGVPHDVVVGSDTVDGGAGEDHIIGDDGMIVADLTLGIPTPVEELPDAAFKLQEYLDGVRRLATDFELVTFEAHHQLLVGMLGTGASSVADPDFHDLKIGNDTIVGGTDADLITGDHGTILTNVVDGRSFGSVSGDISTTLTQSLGTVALQQQQALDDHIAANHNSISYSLTAAELASLPVDFEYDRWIGNDDIQSNEGDDIVVGDFGAYAYPILNEMPSTVAEISTATEGIRRLTDGFARWLETQHHVSSYEDYPSVVQAGNPPLVNGHQFYDQRGGTANQWSSSAGNDTIDAGANNDFVLGDSISISTNVVLNDPAARFSEPESFFVFQFFDRNSFELTDHYVNGRTISNDLIHGGAGNDTLFGQSPTNVLNGDDGIDSLFGGPGNSNTANAGGDGVGDIGRDGSEEYPRDLELNLLEDYQFDSQSPLVIGLVDDIGNARTLI